jgi:PKD repeat protein
MLYAQKNKRKKITPLLLLGVFFLQSIISFVPVTKAYESTDDTFVFYKLKIEGLLQDMEREFRVNNSVTDATLNNIRTNVKEAYNRLPDRGEDANANMGIQKSVELYLDLAQKNKSSQTHVSNAATQTARFLYEAKIEQITGSITANPTSGNAPLTTSFFATAKDPSWVNVPDANYVWWMREKWWYRRELWRGPWLTYTFSKEGNYQVFLDVVSDSRNSKQKVDVLPLTTSQDIEVRPRLWNVILLVNGVNVSNIDQLKISPAVGKFGVLFDATASRAVSNGVISKTEWDFGNGNTSKYDGPPIVERQIFANEWVYRVTLNITSNQWQPFKKEITLIVRDPSAVITTDKESAFLGEEIRMSAKTYLSNSPNIEYNWQVQDDIGKKVVTSQDGSTFSYKFQKVWQYVVTLTSRSPNGNTDTDSKTIIIESHPPTVNLDTPAPMSKEKPNVIVFDASRSFDLDTKSSRWLTYTWLIDGVKVDLDNVTNDGARGTYSFADKGQHSVSLTVANAYGKVTTIDKTFDVTSLLTVWVNITPRAAPINTPITLQARSPQASFFEWNLWDGSPPINGTSDSITHIYNKTGIYTVNLRVKNANGSEENFITRTVYITDTDSPFSLIDINNNSNSITENPNGCELSGTGGSFLVNRSENTSIDGSKSVNVDGNAAGLTYTWKYIGRLKTGPTLWEKFSELWCFPIELTVRSEKNGASHTSKRFLEIRNMPPKLTSITSNMDTTKKDSQKLLVTVNANGARDDDGVITSYVWYYTTESDSEKQNVRITQLPTTTFVLPNISEKYYFWVILEDNDGTRVDSADTLAEQVPLITANDDANINMPLINLSVDKTQVLTDDIINFSVSAKNILWVDVTWKSEYYWDFDGDGHTDKRGSEPTASHSYRNSWRYNMKVKVVNNGVSNTKFQVIFVKNELKAAVKWYHIGNAVYFVNTSKGSYDKAEWNFAWYSSENQYSFMLPWPISANPGEVWTFTIKSGASEVSTSEINESMIEEYTKPENGIALQTFPLIQSGAINIEWAWERILISAFWNDAKEYIIDIDTKIDSDLDGIPDNDKDNKDTASYTDGSVFAITNLASVKSRNREMKLSLIGSDGATIASQKIPVVFNFLPGNSAETSDLTATGTVEAFSNVDKANLEKLQAKIRSFQSDDRIIFTQKYNTLIENWDDLHERTQNLLDIQKEVDESVTLDQSTKEEMSKQIDIILVGDAQATNEISVASRVIEWLVKTDSPDREYIIERLEQIKAHPASLSENKILWKEILQKIEDDSDLSNADKLLLKSQLQIIINGWQDSIPESEVVQPTPISSWSSFLGFIKWALWIFWVLIAIIIWLVLLGYIFYRISRKKDGDMGFQDFLIDSIAHNKSWSKEWIRKEAEAVVKAVELKPNDLNSPIISPQTPLPPVAPIASVTPSFPQTEDLPAKNLFSFWSENSQTQAPVDPLAEHTNTPLSSPLDAELTPLPNESEDLLAKAEEVQAAPQKIEEEYSLEIPNEIPKNTSDEVSSELPSSPLKERPPEATLEEIIPAPPAPPAPSAPEEVHEIPDWLKPLPKTTQHIDKTTVSSKEGWSQKETIVTTDTSSVVSDPNGKKGETWANTDGELDENVVTEAFWNMAIENDAFTTENWENTEKQNIVHDEEEIVPDWLKPVSEDVAIADEEMSEWDTADAESTDDYVPPVIEIPPASTELPDWLKASANESPTSESSGSTQKPKKKKWVKKTPTSLQNKESSNTNNSKSEDIPDWLK